ncbi:MAG: hypothetical protein EKK46_14930 [Rhodocyclaceae bacterium]|nr:MAG: hypothetical protein EKK46_14930 [Rhodocyclaceae bacterium]
MDGRVFRRRDLATLALVLTATPIAHGAAYDTAPPAQAATRIQVAEPRRVPGLPDIVNDTPAPAARSAEASPVARSRPLLLAQNALPSQDATRTAERSLGTTQDKVMEHAAPNVTPAAVPVRQDKSTWYVGGAVGRGGLDTGYQHTLQTLFNTGATQVWVTPRAEDVMWKAYAGYRISPRWSVEGGYWDFGKTGYSADISSPVTTTVDRQFRGYGLGADAVFWLPVTKAFTGFTKLGGVQVAAKASAATPGGGLSPLPEQSSSTFNLHWGLGGEYALTPNLAVRMEYETINRAGDNNKFGTADIILWTLGGAYKF